MSQIDLNSIITPLEMMKDLDKTIVGQTDAKKALAVAFRNRWRRLNIRNKSVRSSVIPKNILLKGPTGVGKTEIARRLAELTNSPFIRVSITDYTMTGYHGNNVTSIIKDLVAKAEVDAGKKPATSNTELDKLLASLTGSKSNNSTSNRIATQKLRNYVETRGVVFIDEIDKTIDRGTASASGEFREGVQRELLTLIEGTDVETDIGFVSTNNILFIAAGSFHGTSPDKLIPELRGRLPIEVALESLTVDDLECILQSTNTSMIKQYQELMKTDGVALKIPKDVVRYVAQTAHDLNNTAMDLGARRLHGLIEALLGEVAVKVGESRKKPDTVKIDMTYAEKRLGPFLQTQVSKQE